MRTLEAGGWTLAQQVPPWEGWQREPCLPLRQAGLHLFVRSRTAGPVTWERCHASPGLPRPALMPVCTIDRQVSGSTWNIRRRPLPPSHTRTPGTARGQGKHFLKRMARGHCRHASVMPTMPSLLTCPRSLLSRTGNLTPPRSVCLLYRSKLRGLRCREAAVGPMMPVRSLSHLR